MQDNQNTKSGSPLRRKSKKVQTEFLIDTRQMIRSFFCPQKIFVPYLTPSSTFVPYMTLRCIFHPATVNCAVKRCFCPYGPHHPSPSSPPPGRRIVPQHTATATPCADSQIAVQNLKSIQTCSNNSQTLQE